MPFGRLPEIFFCGPHMAAKPPYAAHSIDSWRDEVPPNLPENADCVSPVIVCIVEKAVKAGDSIGLSADVGSRLNGSPCAVRSGVAGGFHTPLRCRPARDHQVAGGAQRGDIAINGAAVYAQHIGKIADSWLGALGQCLGT